MLLYNIIEIQSEISRLEEKIWKNHGHKNMMQHVTVEVSKTMQKMQQHTKFNQMNLCLKLNLFDVLSMYLSRAIVL